MRKQKPSNPETEMFERSELPGIYTVKILFEQNNERFKNEYLKKLERSQARQKKKQRSILMKTEP